MTFEILLFHPKVQATGWALLHFLWQGALLAAIFAVANMLTRPSQSRLRCAIGCIVMLLMPVVFIATVLSTDLSPVRSSPAPHPPVLELNIAPAKDARADTRPQPPPPSQAEIPSQVAPAEHAIFQEIEVLPGGVVCLWLLGFFALSIYTATGWTRTQVLRRRGIESVDPQWLETLDDLMRRLQVSGPVRLYVSSVARVPTVIGWLRPYVLLPVSAITGLSEPQLRAVLAHELAHIRRHDYLVNLLQNGVETLLFYHPAVWWVSRRIREERENCCDDLAVAVCGDVMVYAGALAELEELRANISEPALAATGGNLLARIRRLLGVSDEEERIPRSLGTAIMAALVVSVVIGFGTTMHAQSETTPRFEVADIHRSTPASMSRWTETLRVDGSLRYGRYDLRRKTLLELIEIAYDVGPAKSGPQSHNTPYILGGPTWLDLSQFDIAAKASDSTPPETLRLMLQTLLAERFKLVLHKDTKPMPAFVLRIGKGQLKLKQANGSGGNDCEFPLQQNPVTVSCRNMTMKAFGEWLRRYAGAYINKPVVDSTELKGGWDFDFKWNAERLEIIPGLVPRSIVFDAIDKQLGLKLELQKVPVPVLVIDHVNQNPTENSSDVAQKLPRPPAEFEVATIKPTDPKETFPTLMGKWNSDQRSGRIEIRGMIMALLIADAWDIPWGPKDQMFGDAPKWIYSTRFDIVAKAAPGTTPGANIDFRRMLRALLIDRFQMATHYEDRLGPTYELVAAHSKLRKADPSNRSSCRADSNMDISPTVSRLITCQNTTMAQFADRLRTLALDYTRYAEVSDASGIKGAWDFTVNFSPPALLPNVGSGGDTPDPTAGPTDPNGAISMFDALKKQLGLKLEMRKRMVPMLVIDHMEEKPTDN